MNKRLARSELMSLEEYAQKRLAFRAQVMAHKNNRLLTLSDNICLHFEDRLTIQYQVQEALQLEAVLDEEGIERELEVYNALIPDGLNLKATFILTLPDLEPMQQKVLALCGIENKAWLQVEGCTKNYPVVNEDIESGGGESTSTISFMCYEFPPTMIAALQNGAKLYAGIEHPQVFIERFEIKQTIRESLVSDFDEIKIN